MAAVSIKKSIEGFFLSPASIQAQIISWKEYAEMEQQQWRLCEKETIETLGSLLSFVNHNVLQRRVSKVLNKPPYGRQNQTNRHYMFRETNAMKS